MTIKKKNEPKSIEKIVDDITYSFAKITSQKNPILSITINNTGCNSKEELRFQLTNKFFNKINRDYKQTPEILNYLFVIEYPTKVSMGNLIPDNCIPHAHIILETTIDEKTIEFYIHDSFKTPHIYVENITKRSDKNNYLNYLLKQRNLFDIDSYNYKINLPS